MMNLRNCIITGASGGIGSAIAKILHSNGYQVFLQGRNEEKLTALKTNLGSNAQILVGDLNDPLKRQYLISKILKEGPVDMIVNAAGVSDFSSFEEMSSQRVADVITTNLITPILFTREFIEQSSPPTSETTIVNIGSAFGYIGYPGFSVYCASKFGLRGVTESLAREYSDSLYKFAYFAPRATKTAINTSNVDAMNQALGNSVDSADFVAKQFYKFVKSRTREGSVGWPEKLFIRVNSLLPSLVDNAIKSKLPIIKQFLNA